MKNPGLIIVAIIISALFLSWVFIYAEFKNYSAELISAYGLMSLFFIVLFMDFVILPFPPDLIVLSAIWSGASFFPTALVGGVASIVAGSLGYYFGKSIGATRFTKWFGKKNITKGEDLFNKYGIWAVVIGALSPIPYAIVTWSAGIYKMNFNTFLTTVFYTRLPRFFIMGLIGFLL